MTPERQSRRQDTINGTLMIIGSVAITALSIMIGYLVVEDREETRRIIINISQKLDKLEDTVQKLDVQADLCECKIR